jgi:hypothetical protein
MDQPHGTWALNNLTSLDRPHTGMRQDIKQSRHDVCDMTQRKEHSWNEWEYEIRRTPVWVMMLTSALRPVCGLP